MAAAPLELTAAEPARARLRPELWLAGLAFFASGAAGLVYQVAWQRILALQSGVGIYSVAMIVAAFMAGLGIGSHLGGVWSLRLDALAAIRRFVLVEIGIAALGAASCFVYYDLLYTRAMWLYDEPWRAGVMHLAALLPPTVLMGMSLPLLAQAMVAEARTAGSTIGFLYAVNLLGATAGAVLTPWWLIRHHGIRGATYAAAAANTFTVLAGLAAAWMLRRRRAHPVTATLTATTVSGEDAPGTRRFHLWIALYAASGFCALSLELIWFRILDVAVKSMAFTFGTLLALYLLGCGIGSLVGTAVVPRLRRPLRAFLLAQCALLAYAGLAVVLLVSLPKDFPVLDRLYPFWSRGGFTTRGGLVPLLYGVLPALLFGPATVLMGFSFPVLQRAVQDDPRTIGRKVGVLQAANIAGCVAGSLFVGLVAMRWIGSAGTLRLLIGVGIGFAAVGFLTGGHRREFALAAVLLALVGALVPRQQALWMRLHGTEHPSALVQEEVTGVAALVPRERSWIVFVDGKSHSWIPFGGVHTQLGAAPVVIHPAPVDVALIGLGSADTAWAAASRPETQSLDVFEISGGQPRLLRRLAAREPLRDLRRILDDPRLNLRVADGRHALARSRKRYDVIEADAQWPDVAYAGNLYSVEFFRLCGRTLKPGGLVCTWAPTPRVYASFISAFRHVVGTSDRGILIGSHEPIDIDQRHVWRARLDTPEMREYLGQRGVRGTRRLIDVLQVHNRQGGRPGGREMNRDLFPRDEFELRSVVAP